MHPYSVDTDERQRVTMWLAVLSVVLPFLVATGFAAYGFRPPWWISFPSVPSVFAVLYAATDRWVWRWDVLRRVGLIRTPLFEGTWAGELRSSLFGADDTITVRLKVLQRWTAISIVVTAPQSRSASVSASIDADSGHGPQLSYSYRNEPRALADSGINPHSGSCTLRIEKGGELVGEYFTGRGRHTHGEMRLRRVE